MARPRAPIAALVLAAGCALLLTATVGGAQPKSAIPWLTDSLDTPSQPALPSQVATVVEGPISAPSKAGVGVLTPRMSGLPANLWGDLSAEEAIALLQGPPRGLPPAAQALYLRMLLAETDPLEARQGADFLVARIDLLLGLGALEQAEALLDRAGADRADLFQRWFDVEILTGHGERACSALTASPMLAPSTMVRIFCMAREGDWDAAGIALSAAERIGALPQAEADLLALFIDPSLIEEIAPPPPGQPMQALEFVIRETVGLPLSRASAPIAFLHADTAPYVPIRFRMEAAEKLVLRGVLAHGPLFAAYREEVPAASGGIWDRAAAVQEFDAADGGEQIGAALVALDAVMAPVGLRAATAAEYAPRLAGLAPEALPAETRALVARYLLLSGGTAPKGWVAQDDPAALRAAALVQGSEIALPDTMDAREYALLAPFLSETPEELLDPGDRSIAMAGPQGAILMHAFTRLAGGGDGGDLSRGLVLLRIAGQEGTARQVAVELLLLGAQGAGQ